MREGREREISLGKEERHKIVFIYFHFPVVWCACTVHYLHVCTSVF